MFARLTLISLCLLTIIGCSSNPEAKLHRAAARGSVPSTETLIKEGADVNKMVDGRTPLMAAVKRGQPKTMKLLLENGADISVKDEEGTDLWGLIDGPKNFHITSGHARCLALLIEQGVEPRMTLIRAAQETDTKELILALVKAGQDTEQGDENGWTPLHHAAAKGYEDSCEALLEAGANPNSESTKTIESFRSRGESQFLDWRYQAGTRPLDVADVTGGRGHKSCSQIIKEAGGTQNESLENKRRY